MSQDTMPSFAQEKSDTRPRVLLWVTVVVNCVCLIWLMVGVFMRGMRGCESFVGGAKASCESANGGPSAATVILCWVLVDAILLVVWLVKRRRARLAAPSAK